MNNKAAINIMFALVVIAAGIGLLLTANKGMVSITGLPMATPTSCGDVNESLTLTADISGAYQCFNITASNIVLDCDGHTIDGDGTVGSWAIKTKISTKNLTVINCIIKEFETGIYLDDSNESLIYNNTIADNKIGIKVTCSNGAERGWFCSHYNKIIKNNLSENVNTVYFGVDNYGISTENLISENIVIAKSPGKGYFGMWSFHSGNITNNYIEINSSFTTEYPRFRSNYIFNNTFILYGSNILFTSGDNTGGNQFINNFVNYTYGTHQRGPLSLNGGGPWLYAGNILIGNGQTPAMWADRGGFYTKIINNSFTNFSYGIQVFAGFYDSVIEGNNFTDIGNTAIMLPGTRNTNVSFNTFTNVPKAIFYQMTDDYYILEYAHDLGGGYAENNTFINVSETIYSNFRKPTVSKNNILRWTKWMDGIPYVTVDFGNVEEINLSRNISESYGAFRATERLISLDPSVIPELNKSVNVSMRVLSCSPVPKIRYKSTFQKEAFAFTDSDPECNETSTPACTNIVCADNYLNFTVSEFLSYAVEPFDTCIVPKANKDVFFDVNNPVYLCSGTYNLVDGGIIIPGAQDAVLRCNDTTIASNVKGVAFKFIYSNNVTLENCNAENYSSFNALYVSHNNTIRNMTGNRLGGFIIRGSNGNLFDSNKFYNIGGLGYVDAASSYNTFSNTLFNGTGYGGFLMIHNPHHFFFYNNTFSNIPWLIQVFENWLSSHGNEFENNTFLNSGAAYYPCHNCTFKNNWMYNGFFETSENCLFMNNFMNQSSLRISGSNSLITNNTMYGKSLYDPATIWFQDYYAWIKSDEFINNTIQNSPIGIYFAMYGVYSNVTGNYFSNVSRPFISSTPTPNFIIDQDFSYSNDNGTISFGKVTFNLTNETYAKITLVENLVALNSTYYPELNKSTNISLKVHDCSVRLMKTEGFYTNLENASAALDLAPCTTCTITGCANNMLNFTTTEFSSILAQDIPDIITIFPNATNETQPINKTDTNVSIIAAKNQNITFNITAYDSDSTTLTFTWFVNGIVAFIDTVTNLISNIFTSIFSYVFPDLLQTNITVVVNDSGAENDTFTFIREACADNDGDGFSSTPGCDPLDCDDTNPNIRPPKTYETITADTVLCAGTYPLYTTGLTISADGVILTCNGTILSGNSGIGVFVMKSDGSRISDVTVQGCTFFNHTYAVFLKNASNSQILDNTFMENLNGVFEITASNNTLIFNNSFFNNTIGIYLLDSSSKDNISHNLFFNNPDGIYIIQGSNISINDNLIQNSSFEGIYFTSSFDNMVYNNEIIDSGYYGIRITSSTNNKIINNTISSYNNGVYGVVLSNSHKQNIADNKIYGTYFGVYSSNSYNLTIKGGEYSNLSYGIYCDAYCLDSNITNAVISKNNISGIYMRWSQRNLLYNLTINSTNIGIDSFISSNNYINDNRIFNCNDTGILLRASSSNSNIKNNYLFNNSYAIRISGSNTDSSSYNTIQNNTFVNNTLMDIYTMSDSINTLILSQGLNQLRFYNKILNVTDIDNLFIGQQIAAVNSSAEPLMNTSAQILFTGFTGTTTPPIYFFENFTTDRSLAIENGTLCNSSNYCTGITYSSGNLLFNVSRFSSYAAGDSTTPPSGGRCTSEWQCGEWGPCQPQNIQTRTCVDLDGCDPNRIEVRSCVYCNNECTYNDKRCLGKNVQICGNFDEDFCTEWATEHSCGANEICQNGQCVLGEQEIPPVEELPKGAETTIGFENVLINPFACVVVNKTEVTKEAIQSLSDSPYYKNIEKGFEVLVSAFKVACSNNNFDLSFAIPDNYVDVKALKCKAGNCEPVKITRTEQLTCGGIVFENLSRTTEYLEPEFFSVQIRKVELKPGDDVLESSRNKIKFLGDVKGKVTLEQPTAPIKEAENPGIRIVSTPMILTFDNQNPGLMTEVTIPYVVPEKIDEYSISIYAKTKDGWKYLGGKINNNTKTITANITNIMQYADNNQVTLAAMGLPCLVCLDSELTKVYQGTSRDAVILVHGFENSPARFSDILNDIRLTNQPWQAWTFGYPSHKTIDENAKEFADLMQARSREFDFVYIAAHSMGGIITQQMLRYAYDENQKKPGTYTFLNKIKKVIIIASPNKGTLSKGVYEQLFDLLLNSKKIQELFNLNSRVLNDLIEGRVIERVPGIEYYVIAGTKPYDFTKTINITNDGVVSIESAQTIGNEPVVNKCDNYWEINVTHTDILTNYDSRKIVERIVAKEISESIGSKALMGYNQYFDLKITDCSPDDQYIIIGKKIDRKEAPVPANCGCGNGVCGVDEDEVSCPSDCAFIRGVATLPIGFILKFLKPLLWLLLLIVILIAVYKTSKKAIVATRKENKEKKLNDLIVKTRINARLNKLNDAVKLYEQFDKEYYSSSDIIQDKFRKARNDLENEMRRRLK